MIREIQLSKSDPDYAAKQRNIALYQKRDDNAMAIFTGKTLTGEDFDEWTANKDDKRGKYRPSV
jgi:hypothetical protein